MVLNFLYGKILIVDTIDTIITLTTRSRLTYPVLIGRSTLDNNYRINPRKSFLTGKLD